MEIPNSGDQYNLKWNNHISNFIHTFIEHQHGEYLVDVTLSCEGKFIKTHKLILSACSDYFHSIFQVHGNVQHPFILLHGVRFCDLKYILHFMYHGEVKVLDTDLPHVLALGETLKIKGLSSVKLRDVPPDDAAQSELPRAVRRYQRKEHNQKNHITKITKTPPAQSSKLLPSEIPQFIPIYERPSLDCNSIANPVTLSDPLPLISSVVSEAASSNTLVGFKTAPENGSTKNETPPVTNNTSVLKETNSVPPKPPHAFMIFANEWRKKLTIEHPEENNKEISVRLGTMWKNLLPETKNIYYREAKRAEEEHKLKYPDYMSPSNSLKRKADVLTDATNSNTSPTSVDPLQIVEPQEQISLSDSD